MKLLRLIQLIILLGILIVPSVSYAFNISIGGTTWYAWWDPYWDKKAVFSISELDIKPAFLNGPMLSIGFAKKWTISSLFLFGTYDVNRKFIYLSSPPTPLFDRQKIKRYDSDSVINYSLTKYISCFFGFKYMNYKYNTYGYITTSTSTSIIFKKIVMNEYAPGLGITIKVPIIKNFYFLTDLSAIFSISRMKSKSGYADIIAVRIMPFGDTTIPFYRYGINTRASLAYNFSKLHIMSLISFRYQMLQILKHEKSTPRGRDQFYGISGSILYRFEFQGSEQKKD